ncbi:HalOD1 output domain-containing protein [Natronobacterium texcoconense]|uniref:Halobacterial output domain-containing protein n=1 Tax=Natronobacterium texcoconense TaxID=1095778 RepID=A0A1H1IEN2_NATTX|nr:HalOD1 output domain-containing protein [Natronobacterium texcoconense]SDR36074.1 hypothetical protein SAMN04489842_3490 [Natronobacterium texcoconense]
MDRGKRPSQMVVEEVAAAEEIEPVALDRPLYETIDPDALDNLLESATRGTAVTFTYCGYAIRIDESGTVSLSSTDRDGGPQHGTYND